LFVGSATDSEAAAVRRSPGVTRERRKTKATACSDTATPEWLTRGWRETLRVSEWVREWRRNYGTESRAHIIIIIIIIIIILEGRTCISNTVRWTPTCVFLQSPLSDGCERSVVVSRDVYTVVVRWFASVCGKNKILNKKYHRTSFVFILFRLQ
jgi:hypothetical protein